MDKDMVTIQVTKEEIAKKWALDNGYYFITFAAADKMIQINRDADVYCYHPTKHAYSLIEEK